MGYIWLKSKKTLSKFDYKTFSMGIFLVKLDSRESKVTFLSLRNNIWASETVFCKKPYLNFWNNGGGGVTKKCPKHSSKKFWNQLFFKLQTFMIAQNDRNKILNHFCKIHFFPGGLEKLKMGKNVILYPKSAQKILQKNFEISYFSSYGP